MPRPEKIAFDADLYWKYICGKVKKKDEERWDYLARLTDCSVRTVKGWFNSNKIPKNQLNKIKSYIKGERRVPSRPKKIVEPTPLVENDISDDFNSSAFPSLSNEAFETPTFRDCYRWLLACEKHLKQFVIRGDSYSSTAYIRACGGIDIQREIGKLRQKYGEQITFDTVISDYLKEENNND